ncbi:hypothetical protein STXM2123_4270 [Streptomyces sp. F-3]|nr:hypothetical protein STXM2123_4270 [Streptomyces sp. F-3]
MPLCAVRCAFGAGTPSALPAENRAARDRTPGGSAPQTSTVPCAGGPPTHMSRSRPVRGIPAHRPRGTAHGCGSAPDSHRLPPVRV